MMETIFIPLGDTMVNISKVNAFKAHATMPSYTVIYFGGDEQMTVNLSYENVQRTLADTYQQMAMMQAAANRRGYGPAGGSIQ